jgi:hypothetical protein
MSTLPYAEIDTAWIACAAAAATVGLLQQALPCGPNALYGLAYLGPAHSPGIRRWMPLSTVYVSSAMLASSATGSLLGVSGAMVSQPTRDALLSMAAFALLALGILDLANHPVRLIQFDRGRPHPSANSSPLKWTIKNGSALGTGFSSRIGFWMWFLIPVSSYWTGDFAKGAFVFGVYGLCRSASVWLVAKAFHRRLGKQVGTEVWLVSQVGNASMISSFVAVLVGAFLLVNYVARH